MALLLKILAGAGIGYGVAKVSAGTLQKMLAGGIEITAGLLDVVGYVFFIAYILGWRKGGERVGVLWPLSIILEVVANALWNYKA